MEIITPAVYSRFHCIASRCPDTCCQEWDIDVDDETAQFYQTVPGPLGDRIRSALRREEDTLVIGLQNGRCPMQRTDGLCGIQTELGEQALCQVCREFPRLHHDYGSFLELGLEMSCPESARILLTTPWEAPTSREVPGGSAPEYDEEAMKVLLSTREAALSLLSDTARPLSAALILLFFYGLQAQALLDGEDTGTFDPEASLETAGLAAQSADLADLISVFEELDILTEEWKSLLKTARVQSLNPMVRNLSLYLVNRYWLQAVSDYDLYCRVKFVLISCLLVSFLPGDFIWNAHLWSKEIENDADNVDRLLDAAYGDSRLTDAKILGFLRKNSQDATL